MIKSLGTLLAGHPVISGTARSVTGEVILILNLSALERWVSEGIAGGGLAIAPAASLEGSPTGSAVLVVDDSISVRRVVARQLRLLGVDVDEVSDGLEALRPVTVSRLWTCGDRSGDAPARRVRAGGRDASQQRAVGDTGDRGQFEDGRGDAAEGSGAGRGRSCPSPWTLPRWRVRWGRSWSGPAARPGGLPVAEKPWKTP